MIINKFVMKVSHETSSTQILKLTKKNVIGKYRSKSTFYIVNPDFDAFTVCGISEVDANPTDALNRLLSSADIKIISMQSCEITVRECACLLKEEHGSAAALELPEIFGKHGMLPFIASPFASSITEMNSFKSSECEVKLSAKNLCHSPALTEEIDRIYNNRTGQFYGHPIFYSICMDEDARSREVISLLTAALYARNRLKSLRVADIDLDERAFPREVFDDIYIAQTGGTVIVKIPSSYNRCETVECLQETIKYICKKASECRDSVLTIFYGADFSFYSLKKLQASLGSIALYNIEETKLSFSDTRAQLRLMAKRSGCTSTAGLCKALSCSKEYSRDEVENIFSRWYDTYLRTQAYPEYASISRINQGPCLNGSGEDSAFEELESLVGLGEAKHVLLQVRDYIKAQKVYKQHGFLDTMPCLHMAFCGNPGTAKTTVARLVARIFKEYGVLEKGDLVEVSRSDLVGKYVGWTAKAVSDKFREAEGSVLFIDEAYTLLESQEGAFGDEAINQITLEMENHRDNVVVIFAGYKEPMQSFLTRNVGLKSRIAFIIDFQDYTENEMMEIFYSILNQKKRKIQTNTEEKVRDIIRNAMTDSFFGNGRFVRGLVERAMLSQASRIAAMPEAQITNDTIMYLDASDFCTQKNKREPKSEKIGFACA